MIILCHPKQGRTLHVSINRKAGSLQEELGEDIHLGVATEVRVAQCWGCDLEFQNSEAVSYSSHMRNSSLLENSCGKVERTLEGEGESSSWGPLEGLGPHYSHRNLVNPR